MCFTSQSNIFCRVFMLVSGFLFIGDLFYFSCAEKDKDDDPTTTTTTTEEGGGGGSPASSVVVPANAASSITFSDTDLDAGQIAGIVTMTPATTESDITHYLLYWGSSATEKLTGEAVVATLSKTGSSLTYTVPDDTIIPSGATHWIVFTKNVNGEMVTGTSVAIEDNVSIASAPTLAAAAITFSDIDDDEGEIAGTIHITPASDEENITQYILYWGSRATEKLVGESAVTTLEKTGEALEYAVAANTSIPSGATYWIVFTSNLYGEMSTGTSVLITDTANTTPPVPGNSGTLSISSVAYTTLTVNWTKASDDVSSQTTLTYRVYYSTSNNISTVNQITTNGTAFGSATADIASANITGLSAGMTYYFNVLVKDEQNNAAVYTTTSQLTLNYVYLFSGDSSNGNLGGRSGADTRCTTAKSSNYPSLNCTHVRAFISVSADDEVRDMPSNYSIPTSLAIAGPTGTVIGNTWSDILDSSISSSLTSAGVVSFIWYSGSYNDGSVSENTCNGWTSADGGSYMGASGSHTSTAGGWIGAGSNSCNSAINTICICW